MRRAFANRYELNATQRGPEDYPIKSVIGHYDIRSTAENRHLLEVANCPADSLFGHPQAVDGRKRGSRATQFESRQGRQ